MANPVFYELFQEGTVCSVCMEPMEISPYTLQVRNCPKPITFIAGCIGHPLHKDCHINHLISLQRNYNNERERLMRGVVRRRRMNPQQAAEYIHRQLGHDRHLNPRCATCNEPFNDDQPFHFTAMYPPPAHLVPDPPLPLAPAGMRDQDFAQLTQYRSGCCEHRHLRGEWIVIAHPCSHTLHTRCYLNLRMGDDLSWRRNKPAIPVGPVHCPTCQVEIQYVTPKLVANLANMG